MAISTNPDDPNFGLETDDTSPNFGLPTQEPQGGGIIGSIASQAKTLAGQAVGLLNPITLARGVLDIQPRSGLQEVLRTGRMLRDIVGVASIQETLEKEAPEVAQQQKAILGAYGPEAQRETLTGIGTQLGMAAAPFVHGRVVPLRDIAFGKPVEATPKIPETPITEAVTIETQQPIGGEINAEQISKPTQVHGDVQYAPRPEEGTGALPADVGGEGVPPRGQGEIVQQTPQEVAPVPQPEQPHPLQDQTYYRGTNPNRVSGEDTFYSAHKPTAEEYSAGGLGGVEGNVEEVKGQSLPKNLYQATNKEELAAELGISQDIYGMEFDNAVKSKLQSQGYEGVSYEEGTTLGDLTSGGQEEIHVFSKKALPKTEEAGPQPPAAAAPEGGTGISNQRLTEAYGDNAPIAQTGKGPGAWKDEGLSRLDNFQKTGDVKNDPYSVLTNLREGKVPVSQLPSDVSLLRAEHQRLLEDARKSEGTPEYADKSQAALNMATAIKEVAHGPASDVFRSLQEYDKPRYDNVTDFDQALREREGRESTSTERVQFKKMADDVASTRNGAEAEINSVQKKISKYPRMEFEDAYKSVHDQIAELTKDCIIR